MKGITKAQNELARQKVEVRYFFFDKYSETSCERAMKTAEDSDLNSLIIAPVLSKVCDKFLNNIHDGLPFIFFDSYVPRLSYTNSTEIALQRFSIESVKGSFLGFFKEDI